MTTLAEQKNSKTSSSPDIPTIALTETDFHRNASLNGKWRLQYRGAIRSTKRATNLAPHLKYWEIIADNLSKAGWNLGCVSAVDSTGRMIWIVDAHRDDGKRFVVRADEKLTAFMELESAILQASQGIARSLIVE